MALILASTLLARLAILSVSVRSLHEVRRTWAPLNPDESWSIAMKRRMSEDVSAFFDVLLGYDRATAGISASIVNLLNIAHIIWGTVGAVWSAEYIVLDDTECDAAVLRLGVHVYVLVFVSLLSFLVPMLCAWLLGAILQAGFLTDPLLRRARMFDDSYSSGVPVASLVVRSFLLRRVKDIFKTETSDLEANQRELKHRLSELDKESADLDKKLRQKEQRFDKVRPALQGPSIDRDRLAEELAAAREAGLNLQEILQHARQTPGPSSSSGSLARTQSQVPRLNLPPQ